jgi:DNA primase
VAPAFVRELLESPWSFYDREAGRLTRPNRKRWAMGNCRFHKSKSRRSLSVNVDTGAWHCFGCGAHGGDIVSFVMTRDGCDFRTACKTLGAWRNVSDDERRQIDLQNAQWRKQQEEEARLKQLAHDQLIELRAEIHTLVAIQAETASRLSELLGGAAPNYPDEVEACWSVLSLVVDDLRQCEADYMARAGLEYAA